jgi:hypothetical protein
MRLNIEEIVDLHQIDSLCAQKRHRAFHGFNAVLLSARPNFGGEKKFVANAECGSEFADHLLGAPVHWR